MREVEWYRDYLHDSSEASDVFVEGSLGERQTRLGTSV